MTNEQLAEFIKQGGADDLKPALWDRVKHLMFKLAGQYYSSYEERFTACGAELADFRQVTNSVKALCTLWERPQAHGVAVCGVGAFVLEFQHSRLALHSLENALTAVE